MMKNCSPLTLMLATAVVFTMQLADRNMTAASAQDDTSAFTSSTIDIGMVVSDADASFKFYTAALGMQEAGGFEVPQSICGDSGLTEKSGLKVKIVKLSDGKGATSLKLVEVIGAESAKQPNDFIETQLGLSYITLHVSDMNKSVERLEAAGAKVLAKGPVELAGMADGVFLTLVRDPDGNFVELVGPGKK